MCNIYTDKNRSFVYVEKSKDNNKVVNIRIEEVQKDNTYNKLNIELNKSEVEDLILKLEELM